MFFLILFWKAENCAQLPLYHYSLYFLAQKVRRIQISVWLKLLGIFSPSLWWTCYVWIFKQKQPRITDAELVTSLTLQDGETFGSGTISCLIPAQLSQESVKWLVGMVWEQWERCCITHREECQHRFVREVDGLHLAGWLVYLIVWFYEGFLPPLVKLATSSAYKSC